MTKTNLIRALSASALLTHKSPLEDAQVWGPWHFDAKNRTLIHSYFEIDLETCTSSAAVLDWLGQATQKEWCSTEDAGYLLAAFTALFDLQQPLCSDGQNRKFKPTARLKALLIKKPRA